MEQTILFPGQGGQFRGMGKNLFLAYPKYVSLASDILKYSIEALCLEDKERKLNQTEYTQPALYVVNALSYYLYRETHSKVPSFFAGHSLGEYNALLAAGAFDFETGLRLVQKRGALMAKMSGGSMLAVLGIEAAKIQEILSQSKLKEIDIANYNTPTQTILSGPTDSMNKAESIFNDKKIRCIPLNVSAAFHSRYMAPAQIEFEKFLNQFSFSPLKTPVIANVTARPYGTEIAELLSRQVVSSVQWTDSILYLIEQGEMEFVEMGNQSVLSKMVREIQKTDASLTKPKSPFPSTNPLSDPLLDPHARRCYER